MDGNGVLSKLVKLGSISLTLGLLSHLENQRLEKEKIKSIPRVGDLWIPSYVTFQDVVSNSICYKYMIRSRLETTS
jgi:hypothetical protein